MSSILIHGGLIVNEGRSYTGYVIVRNGVIETVAEGAFEGPFDGERIDASGCWVLPGAIDDQVHFREPGLTYKADIASESAAAVAGGVTSFMDMPNVKPPTVTLDLLEQKFETAARTSSANYSFYLGATNDNGKEVARVDPRHVCGVKVFMGSSTGNMLVDDTHALAAIFDTSPVVVATHCEDEARIRARMAEFRNRYGDDAPASIHPLIRDAEACYISTARAVELADRYQAQLNVLHLSTARELSLFESGPVEGKAITAEVCVHHLWFSDRDYAAYGNRIKWNPAIKSPAHPRGEVPTLLVGTFGRPVDPALAAGNAHSRRTGTLEQGKGRRKDVPRPRPAVRSCRPRIPAQRIPCRHRHRRSATPANRLARHPFI